MKQRQEGAEKRKPLLDDLGKNRKYWNLVEKALDRTLWRTPCRKTLRNEHALVSPDSCLHKPRILRTPFKQVISSCKILSLSSTVKVVRQNLTHKIEV